MPKQRKKPEWLRQYETISPSTRKDLGITKVNFQKEFATELRHIRRSRK